VAAGGVGDHGGEDPALIGEEQPAGAEVGVPLDLHRVGGVQPLPRPPVDVQQQMGAGVAREVREPQLGAAGQNAVRVGAARDGLGPDRGAGQKLGPVARRHHRHGFGTGAVLGAGMFPGSVCRRCRHGWTSGLDGGLTC